MSRRRFRVRVSLLAAAVTVVSFATPLAEPTNANAALSLVPGPTNSLSQAFNQSSTSFLCARW